jgi:hypothetical protein
VRFSSARASDLVLELPNLKLEFSLLFTILSWWFLEYVHKVFDKISVRQ